MSWEEALRTEMRRPVDTAALRELAQRKGRAPLFWSDVEALCDEVDRLRDRVQQLDLERGQAFEAGKRLIANDDVLLPPLRPEP
jgi:hypothetical protein